MKLGGQNKPLVIGSGSGPVTEHNKLKGLSYEESGHTGFQKAEEGKGLSTNDFTTAEKTQLSNLKGAYVFIGSFANLVEVTTVLKTFDRSCIAVFNYLGEDTTISQPNNYNPYVVTIVDQGCAQIAQGDFRYYFSVPQSQAIIFKVGMPVEIYVDAGDEYYVIVDTISYIRFVQDINTNDVKADICLTSMSDDFNGSITGVSCTPTVVLRTGDNVAVLNVGGRDFYEVLSHDYGEDLEIIESKIVEIEEKINTDMPTVDLSGYATTEYVNGLIGDIATELDEVIELQEDWINSVEATLPVEPDNGEVEEI